LYTPDDVSRTHCTDSITVELRDAAITFEPAGIGLCPAERTTL
jgi:hypothetical protein